MNQHQTSHSIFYYRLYAIQICYVTHSSGNQNRGLSCAECLEGLLTFTLGAITMDTACWVSFLVQEVFQGICSLLGFHKHQSQRVWACIVTYCISMVVQSRPQVKHNKPKAMNTALNILHCYILNSVVHKLKREMHHLIQCKKLGYLLTSPTPWKRQKLAKKWTIQYKIRWNLQAQPKIWQTQLNFNRPGQVFTP